MTPSGPCMGENTPLQEKKKVSWDRAMNHKSNKDAKSEPQNQAACSVWAKPETTWGWRRPVEVVTMVKAPQMKKQRLGVWRVQTGSLLSSLSCDSLHAVTEMSCLTEPPQTGEREPWLQELVEVRVRGSQEHSPPLTASN